MTVSNGYVVTCRKGHPAASPGGSVGEHRLVLYEKIGPGMHTCHWCGVPVTWGSRSKVLHAQRLVADHVDDVRHNNDPDNLVPACLACNSTRVGRQVARRVLRSEVYTSAAHGPPWMQLVLECGHTVVRRKHRAKRAWCMECAGSREPPVPEKSAGLGAAPRAVVPTGGYVVGASVGPMRHVVRELGYERRADCRGYRYRYHLECGHDVHRNSPGRTLCACPWCK